MEEGRARERERLVRRSAMIAVCGVWNESVWECGMRVCGSVE